MTRKSGKKKPRFKRSTTNMMASIRETILYIITRLYYILLQSILYIIEPILYIITRNYTIYYIYYI